MKVIAVLLIAGALCLWLIARQHRAFHQASAGRDYFLGFRTLETEDAVVKAHYRRYLITSLWQSALVLGVTVPLLFWVEG